MSFWNRFFNTLRPGRVDSELRREMETHLAEAQDDAVRNGADEQQARRNARLQFGNPASYREEARERNLFAWLEILFQDLRYTLFAVLHHIGKAAESDSGRGKRIDDQQTAHECGH